MIRVCDCSVSRVCHSSKEADFVPLNVGVTPAFPHSSQIKECFGRRIHSCHLFSHNNKSVDSDTSP